MSGQIKVGKKVKTMSGQIKVGDKVKRTDDAAYLSDAEYEVISIAQNTACALRNLEKGTKVHNVPVADVKKVK